MAMPEGVQVVLDDAFSNDARSEDNLSDHTDRSLPGDAHRERFGKYVPPHLRGHVYEEGDQFVNFRDRDPKRGADPDRVEGADNDKYQRLKVNVNFALGFNLIRKHLKPQFPGYFFHCSGNANHDHPISHVVTQIGTRLLQRRIYPGSVVMDVFGNPNATERFNKSQSLAALPKIMTALCNVSTESDFLREVNKMGPVLDTEGKLRYLKMTLEEALESGECDKFDTYQMIHTLYYVDFHLILKMLQTPSPNGKIKRVLALVHRHDGQRGSINCGEQTFEVKQHRLFRDGLLKQINVKTNSAYVHPNLTPLLFKEKKVWFPSDGPLEMRDRCAEKESGVGLTWECHMVNDDTWIIEMVLCHPIKSKGPTFEELWDEDQFLEQEDFLAPSANHPSDLDRTWENRLEWLPAIGNDREFAHLDLVSKPLFEKLRLSAAARPRSDRKVLDHLMKEAKNLTNPSALFGDADGISCPPEKIVDHVIAALLVDYQKEGKVMDGMMHLLPQLRSHAEGLKLGGSYRGLSFNSLLDVIRNGLKIARQVNHVARNKDPIDAGIGALDGWLTPE